MAVLLDHANRAAAEAEAVQRKQLASFESCAALIKAELRTAPDQRFHTYLRRATHHNHVMVSHIVAHSRQLYGPWRISTRYERDSYYDRSTRDSYYVCPTEHSCT